MYGVSRETPYIYKGGEDRHTTWVLNVLRFKAVYLSIECSILGLGGDLYYWGSFGLSCAELCCWVG